MLRFGLAAAFALSFLSSPLFAWSEHAMLGYYGLITMLEIKNAQPVPAESLESFLQKEEAGLEKVLADIEEWNKKNLVVYPVPTPEIAFKRTGIDHKRRFLEALRMDPESRTPLYLQLLPGQEAGGRPAFPVKEISVFKNPMWIAQTRFTTIREGEAVLPLEVVASACDEPDYGFDIGIWQDNNSPHSKKFNMGIQPFGNPNLEYGSQAPVHMGFYHEAGIIYLLAGFLKRTYPEMRVHQAYALSRFAFRTGHPYWGFRFMGWGLHYVQDLTQPYHARVLPGVGTLRMLWINFMDIIGRHEGKKNIVQLVSNRHLALENFQRRIMTRDLRNKDLNQPYWFALQNTEFDSKYNHFNKKYLRDVLTEESVSKSDELSREIMALMPVRLVDDPGVEFEEEKGSMDLLRTMETNQPGSVSQFANVLARLTGAAGVHSRNYVRAILATQDTYDSVN
ncbi:MAG TPA: phospholipase [Leptospiraceae bacterium]|nr:phospholipase [Leptospiraceae bacterium]HNL70239.1 phospholipase [Leptospiraceae bacterium]